MPQDNIVKIVWLAAIIFIAVTYGRIILETIGFILVAGLVGNFMLWLFKNMS